MNDVKIRKHFNTEGVCFPEEHYMVDLEKRCKEIKKLIDARKYFTITKARQYGKTTTLKELARFLHHDYLVVSLDFQRFSGKDFQSEENFTAIFARILLKNHPDFVAKDRVKFEQIVEEKNSSLSDLFDFLSDCCGNADKPVVMLIDEVDNASNNQVFLDFLSQLRNYYLDRKVLPTFHSVILAGVYDIKNLKMKIHPDEPSRKNSPWNIAADFNISMNFSASDITRMLSDYEEDYKTGMDMDEISTLIYDYTAGYPCLVSRICKLIDEIIVGTEQFPTKESAWTKEGILQAIKLILDEKSTLFDSLIRKITDYKVVEGFVYTLLFSGKTISYNPDIDFMNIIMMFGFAKNNNGVLTISNRIYETRLYNYFISQEFVSNEIYSMAFQNKNQFINNDELHMERILEKFAQHFNDIYGNRSQAFKEEEGRKYFLLYLKPIINGVGNYYIEAQTRDMRRTDIIIDYRGKQYIIEMKIWHGDEYNTRGEQQLTEYLDYYHLEKGYLLSFNFNQHKEVGVKHIEVGGKTLIEAVV
ncbi:MAG: AAA-like domain-containing protein [Eubacteriales bacterium]